MKLLARCYIIYSLGAQSVAVNQILRNTLYANINMPVLISLIIAKQLPDPQATHALSPQHLIHQYPSHQLQPHNAEPVHKERPYPLVDDS